MLRTFRPARPMHPGLTYLKTLLHTIVFWVVFLLVLPLVIRHIEALSGLPPFEFTSQSWLPWVAFAMFGALGIGSSVYMVICGRGTPLPIDCASQLVVAGPYQYVRNPMAIAGLGQAAAVGLLLGSAAVIFYAIFGGFVWNSLVRPIEEEYLWRSFGPSYEDYRSQVSCWLPRISPYRSTE